MRQLQAQERTGSSTMLSERTEEHKVQHKGQSNNKGAGVTPPGTLGDFTYRR